MNKEIDEGDALNIFFSLIQKFNGNVELDYTLKVKIEDYYMYKWKADRNSAMNDPDEVALLD